jgi:hypothetical protein
MQKTEVKKKTPLKVEWYHSTFFIFYITAKCYQMSHNRSNISTRKYHIWFTSRFIQWKVIIICFTKVRRGLVRCGVVIHGLVGFGPIWCCNVR